MVLSKGARRSAIIEDLVLTVDDLQLPDEELGIRFLSICIATEAESRGIPFNEVGVDFADWVIKRLSVLVTDQADLVVWEKVIHEAASGQVGVAGRLLREGVINKTIDLAIFNCLIGELERKLKGPKAGGAKTAQITKAKTLSRNKKIRERGRALDASGNPRETNSKLAALFDRTSGQIRRIRKNKK